MESQRTAYDVVEVLSIKRHQWIIPSGESLGGLEATIRDVHTIGSGHFSDPWNYTDSVAKVEAKDGRIVISFEVRSEANTR